MAGLVRHVVSAVAVASVALGGAGNARPVDGGSSVAVLALPGTLTTETTPGTHQLAEAMARTLRSTGFRVVLAGTPNAVPLEELTAVANASGVDLVLGVRSLGASELCAAVVAPQPVSRPAQPSGPAGEAELGAMVKQMMAFTRFEESARFVGSLPSVLAWCHPKPTKVERYVLQGTLAPTVLISVSSRDEGRLTELMPGVVQGWLAIEGR